MSLSAAELSFVGEELQRLAGARVQKVAQPGERAVALELWQPGAPTTLLVDASPGLARVGVVERRPPSPVRPFAFQGQLRAHLTGARLDALEVDGPARVVRLRLATDDGARSLVVELDGRGGDVLLLDAGDAVLGASRPDRARLQRRTDAAGRGEAWRAPAPAGRPDDARNRFERAGDGPFARSAAIEAAYGAETTTLVLATAGRQLKAALTAALRRSERTLDKIDTDARRVADAGRFQRLGDLLKGQAHRLGRGATSTKVTEYTEDGPVEVTVPLLAHLNGRENLERYYRQHKRLSRAGGVVEGRRDVVRQRVAALGTLLARLDHATTPEEIERLADDARAAGLTRERAELERPEVVRALPYREFTSASGRPIRVGRNARGNDALTFEFSRGNDLWLHARGLTGAHVVLPGLGASEGPDGETLLDAGTLAAHFSAGRGELVVDVAWTRRKFVGRPRKAAPGAVTYTQERVLTVRRDDERLRRLLAAERVRGA